MKNVKKFELPPPTQEKAITMDLKSFIPPAPEPKPKIKPLQQQSKSIPPAKVLPPKPIAKPEPKKATQRDHSLKTLAMKDKQENNATQKPKQKQHVVQKKEGKPSKQKITPQRPHPLKNLQPMVQKSTPHPAQDPLENLLMDTAKAFYSKPRNTFPSPVKNSYANRMIKQLYGPEFRHYTPTQQKFIRNNLDTIHRITQNTLVRNGYPSVAVQTRQQGTNVVSFYLHPNGDISNLMLKSPIGYTALDENTLEVIRIAYKDYPLPNQKTKIIFSVTYTLY